MPKKQHQTRSPQWNDKNKAGNLMTRLYKCGMGEIELEPARVSSIKTFLAKIIPDISAVTMSGELTHTHKELTPEKSRAAREELIKYAKKFTEPTTPTTH